MCGYLAPSFMLSPGMGTMAIKVAVPFFTSESAHMRQLQVQKALTRCPRHRVPNAASLLGSACGPTRYGSRCSRQCKQPPPSGIPVCSLILHRLLRLLFKTLTVVSERSHVSRAVQRHCGMTHVSTRMCKLAAAGGARPHMYMHMHTASAPLRGPRCEN